MNRFLSLASAVLVLASCAQSPATADKLDDVLTLGSPGGTLSMEFGLTRDGTPAYALYFGDRAVVLPSTLGYEFRGEKLNSSYVHRSSKVYSDPVDFHSGFRVLSSETSTFDETWEPVWGEESSIRNHYNELAVTLGKNNGGKEQEMVIRFRLYDDGLGFRYEFPYQGWNLTYFVVKEELTSFRMSGDHTACWIPGDYDTQEYSYTVSRLSEIEAEQQMHVDYNASQQVFSKRGVQTALQMKTDDGLYINIHEAAVLNYPAASLEYDPATRTFTTWLTPDAEGWKGRLQAPCTSPWRTVMVTDDARRILSSRLILNLNEPCAIPDAKDWVHPVKYMGVWWEMITDRSKWSYTSDVASVRLGETDYANLKPHGNHGANNANVRRYIDFAAANGFDALLIEGWNTGWEDWFGHQKFDVFDFVTPYPDFDLPALNDYAHGKGIFANGEERRVTITFEHKVTVNLIAEDDHFIFTCQRGHLTLHVAWPRDADGVVRVAKYHHTGMFIPEDAFQPRQVHLVEPVGTSLQRIVHHKAVVALDEHPEGVIHRLLNDHLVARASEMVQRQPKAIHDATDKTYLLLTELQPVASTLPVDDRLPVALQGNAVAIDGVFRHTLAQRPSNLRAGGEAHIGNPQGQHILAPEHLLAHVHHHAAAATAVYHAVKIISLFHIVEPFLLYLSFASRSLAHCLMFKG